MTTGPLGQGVASAVGFAYGQRYERGLLDPDAPEGKSPFDHKVWVICGEGDIEEGVSGEASSLAGNEQLGNLFVFFDANHIQIEGETKIALDENVIERYKAYGWYTDEFSFIQPDGSYKEDIEGLSKVIEKAEQVTDRPHFIKVDTLIAWPTRARPTILRPTAPLWATRPSRVSRRPSASIRRRPSKWTKRHWPTPARSQSAASRHTRNGMRPSRSGPTPTRTRLLSTTASRTVSCLRNSTRPLTISKPASKPDPRSQPARPPAP